MAGEVDAIFSIIGDMQTILLYGWPFLILFWILILKFLYKKWPVDVVIIEKRGTNLIKTNDRAGKYVDSFTGLTGYKLQKAKDTIPVINYDWVLHNVSMSTTLFDRLVNLLRGNIGTLFLFKYGAKQYKPINIVQNNQRKLILKEIKNKNNQPTLVQIYEQFDPRKHLGALDFEVIDWDNMNFMVQEQRASFERRQKKNEWLKQVLIPLVALAIAGLVCIIMIKFSYDYAMAMKGGTTTNENTKATAPNIPIISDVVNPNTQSPP
jgi:hypothetical protein